jgi:hypothetical protein
VNGFFVALMMCCLQALTSEAATSSKDFQIQGNYSFQQNSYGGDHTTTMQRWGGAIGYAIFSRSEILLSYQVSWYRVKILPIEDSLYTDTLFSMEWQQYFLPLSIPFQPYVKLGGGALEREAFGYRFEDDLVPRVQNLTAILGLGVRWMMSQALGLKFEANSYLAGGMIRTWKENLGVSVGCMLYL